MQQYPLNSVSQSSTQVPNQGPNAVSINIYSPQAYGQGAACAANPIQSQGYYPMYGQNINPNLPLYPANYNNMFNQNATLPNSNSLNSQNPTNLVGKTPNNETEKTNEDNKKDEETKTIVPLTDDYIKSLENYLNDSNPKVRLIAAKDVMQRFKEDENRKDNPSLIPLLNKILKDPSSTVRFLGLVTMQLGYSVGNDETVQILKQLQSENKDKTGEEQSLISEILLKMSAPDSIEVKQGK